MLSNHLFQQQKIVLLKDKLGIERDAHKIVSKFVNEQKGDKALLTTVESLTEQGAFLFARVSKLSRSHEPAALFRFVQLCRKSPSLQCLFLWATEKNILPTMLVAYLEHMSELIVTFEDGKHLSILAKKSTGSVSNRFYRYQALNGTLSIVERKKSERTKASANTTVIDPASLGTFKIGDLKQDEQEAKDSLTLPFEFYKTTSEGGKVLYHPDAEDDLDEEDPDDDLLI
ncbi:elongator complex protein 5 [Wyeomyia smithii]|uniref:elongator complex protein 5 n=1 Tax=Wyeomyia smithii TaxID=174621 RepID=UPI002467CB84|nr:elongator complex protein 5 [Wyeomyia smithii]